MSIRVWNAVMALILAAGVAAAGTRGPVITEARRGPRASPGVEKAQHAASCFEGYWNVGVPDGFYYPAGAGVEVLDDLHLSMIQVNQICALDFGYFKEAPGTATAVVSFYGNDQTDTMLGPMLTSLILPGLAQGESSFHVEVPAAMLDEEIWVGVSFDTPDAGMLTAGPPWPGASDDYFYLRPPNEFYTFGGSPPGNFLLGVYATGSAVDVEEDVHRSVRAGFLSAPRPNPSPRSVDLSIGVQEAGRVKVHVMDAAGRLVAVVKDEVLSPGSYPMHWDGRTLAGRRARAGVYLIELTMPRFAGVRKVVLMD